MRNLNLSRFLNSVKKTSSLRLLKLDLTRHTVILLSLLLIVSLIVGYSNIQKKRPLVARQNILAKEVASLKQEQEILQLVADRSTSKMAQPIQEAYGEICEYTSLAGDSLNLKAKMGLPTFSDLGVLETYIKPSDIRGIKSTELLLIAPTDHQTFSYLVDKVQARFPVNLNRIMFSGTPGGSSQGNFQASFTLYGL